MDITTMYGYLTKQVIGVENNGLNPVTLTNINIVNLNDIHNARIYVERINSLPLTIVGNTTLDLLYHVYSLSTSDVTSDITFDMFFNVYDFSDLTSMIGTQQETFIFTIVNKNFWDSDDVDTVMKRSRLNRHFFKLPIGGFSSVKSLDTNNAITVQKFTDDLLFKSFQMKYADQFSVLLNSSTGNLFILGRSLWDENEQSLKYIIGEQDVNNILNFEYDWGYLFFSDV